MGAPAKLTVGDTEVTRIGLGTNRLTDSPEGAAFIRAAVAAGIEHIDTAHLYTGGASERAIGAALSPLSAGCVVATKGGYGGAGHGRPEALRAEIEESLRSLRTEAIPLYYRCAATSRRRWPRSPSGTARPGARSRSPGCCRRSPVMLPIPGTLSLEHVEENLRALEIELTDDELAALR